MSNSQISGKPAPNPSQPSLKKSAEKARPKTGQKKTASRKGFKKRKDFFALTFSDYRLRLALANKKGQLRYYSEKKLPQGVISRGRIKNPKVLVQALAEIIKVANIKQKFVVVGLPEVRAFTRSFVLPALPREELDDAVRWESEPLLPFPPDKTYLDWMILEKSRRQVRVLVVALPQVLVEDYARLLEALGFQPIAFEINSLSLARMCPTRRNASLMLEIEENEAVLIVVGPSEGIEVSSTIAFDTAGEINQETIQTAKKLLSFYQKKLGEAADRQKVNQVFLCGVRAEEGLRKLLEQELRLPTHIMATPKPHLVVMASLAAKNVAAPIDEKTINLIPPRIQGVYDQTARIKKISAWLKVGLTCLLLICFGYSVMAAHVYFESKKIEKKIIELQAASSEEMVAMETQANRLNHQAQKIITLAGPEAEIISLLSLIKKTAPSELDINQLSYDGDQKVILVDGNALSRSHLLAFRRSLEDTGKFVRVQVPLSSLERETNVHFTLSLTSKE